MTSYEFQIRARMPGVPRDVLVVGAVMEERVARRALADFQALDWRDTNYEDFRLLRREVGEWQEQEEWDGT